MKYAARPQLAGCYFIGGRRVDVTETTWVTAEPTFDLSVGGWTLTPDSFACYPGRDEATLALAHASANGLTAEDDPPAGTLGWLRNQTDTLPAGRPVILQKEAEGNGYSPLRTVSDGMYLPYNAYCGEVYPTAEQIAADPDRDRYEPEPGGSYLAVVLGPVN